MGAVAIWTVLFSAFVVIANGANPLAFTYMTFVNGSVSTATTSYGSPTPSAYSPPGYSSMPTSYKLKSKDLAYPTFSSVPASVATAPAASGLPNAAQFAGEAFQLILLFKNANSTNCQLCKDYMSTLAKSMEVRQETLATIANPFCQSLSLIIPFSICVGLLNIASTDMGGVVPAMDMQGEDGQIFCAFMFGLCELPPVPPLDLDALFKSTKKPAPKKLKPSKKEPLKVLHISDYHLDLRYVVGSEANCGGNLCCRVFPYTNVSIPIKEPASLFGNYQCDTPEALATSVFRSVPDVTGYNWDDFSFGIFTGDLVSHDIWELTKKYVLAEELQSYQEFFDGMGGVPMYPTLGNHDTFPHAFTAFPNQNKVLPANASYHKQQLYNYQRVAKAWANYGWLSSSEAQTVVSSGLGIYRAKTKDGLTIISLNSDAWYYFNFYAYIGANDPSHTGIFTILIDYLLEAEASDCPVWLIQHVNTGGSTTYEALPAPTDLFYQIVDRFNNTIRATFFGHTHRDEFGLFYANNATEQSAAAAAAVAYIMPSVTPYQNLNAGFRYYLVDADSFAVIDSITYYANVSNTESWTADGEVTWEFEYSARDAYSTAGNSLQPGEPLSPAWWHNVAENIASNDTAFELYTDLRTKKYRPYESETGAAKNITLCGLTSMSVPIFERCLMSMKSTTSFLRR